MLSVRVRFAQIIGTATLVVLIPSCNPSGPKLYPVTGQILYEGQPVGGAIVVFHPVNPGPDNRLPGATAGTDGNFSLKTYPYGEGAPEGEYVALVSLLEEGKGQDAQPKNKLPGRYSDTSKSGLKVTVKPAPNALEPFRLTKSP